MIESLAGFPEDVVAVRFSNQVSKVDYDTILIPAVDAAFAQHPNVKVYCETAPSFTGLDPGAMWEDFKVGVEHFAKWERVAVVTNVAWLQHAMRLFAFLLPAKARLFAPQEADEARAWIGSSAA